MVDILLVDDEPQGLLALEAALAELGHNLVRAQSGKDALRYLLSHGVAVILLDVRMPTMDGFETATLVRQRERSQHTPIIFLTGVESNREQLAEAYALGAVDYIVKPADARILRSKVSVFVELHQQTEELKQQRDHLARELTALRGFAAAKPEAETASLETVKAQYRELVKAYLTEQAFDEAAGVAEMAQALSEAELSGKEVLNVHLDVMDQVTSVLSPTVARQAVGRARVLLVGLMTELVDRHREQATVSRAKSKKSQTRDRRPKTEDGRRKT